MRRDAHRPALALALLAAIFFAPAAVQADLIVVDGTTCTLVDAITSAETDTATGGCATGSGPDTIRLDADASLVGVAVGSSALAGSQAGTSDISTDVTIVAGAGSVVERDAALADCSSTPFRLFQVLSGGSLTLEGLTLRNGCGGHGGAVFAEPGSALEVLDSRFEGNTATGFDAAAMGGALSTSGNLTVTDSVFESNSAGGIAPTSGFAGLGGAIAMDGISKLVTGSVFTLNSAAGGSAEVTGDGDGAEGGAVYSTGKDLGFPNGLISGCLFEENSVEGGAGLVVGTGGVARGGGLALLDLVNVTDSSFVDNSAVGGDGETSAAGNAFGGGVLTLRDSALVNLTLSGNLARGGDSDSGGDARGGGWHHAGGTASAIFLTATENLARAGDAGALGSGGVDVSALANIDNSLLAGNVTRDAGGVDGVSDCETTGVVTSGGFNLVQVPSSCTFAATGDATGLDPELIDLANNGCQTRLPDGRCLPTLSPSATSPALDAGSCATAGFSADARGSTRPWDVATIANADDGCDVGAFEFVDQDADGIEDGIDCDPADSTNVCLIFTDGFESGDFTAWSGVIEP